MVKNDNIINKGTSKKNSRKKNGLEQTIIKFPSFNDVVAAAERIKNGIIYTPCVYSDTLSQLCNAEIWCKLDYLQSTGSFKERGGLNSLLLLDSVTRAKGVITASAGNHALSLAYHGRSMGIPVTIVMPQLAPIIKRERCLQLGASVIIHGDNIYDAQQKAYEIVADKGLHYINGYNDVNIITGAGTIALEIFEQCPNPDAIIVPVGGGGLIAGICVVAKILCPTTEIIGVESSQCPSMTEALKAGRPVKINPKYSLADGLDVPKVGALSFQIARSWMSGIVNVSEISITQSITHILDSLKGVVEGAGATPLAAFIEGSLDHLQGKRVVLVLCGGNIDLSTLSNVINKGLEIERRLVKFIAFILDYPGCIVDFKKAVVSTGAIIKQLLVKRVGLSHYRVLCVMEVTGSEHTNRVFIVLRHHGIKVSLKNKMIQQFGGTGRCVTEFGKNIGFFKDIPAYSNCNNNIISSFHNIVNKNNTYIYSGMKWQCVEYARRYLITKLGFTFKPVNNAVDIFMLSNVESIDGLIIKKFKSFKNGDNSYFPLNIPIVNDLIIWEINEPDVPYGHVAVVLKVERDNIYIGEQNWSNDIWMSQNYSRILKCNINNNKCLIEDGKYPILGWKRAILI
jgi:threonine dehydratase